MSFDPVHEHIDTPSDDVLQRNLRNNLLQWYEDELKPEFQNINQKLDRLMFSYGGSSTSHGTLPVMHSSPRPGPKLADILSSKVSSSSRRATLVRGMSMRSVQSSLASIPASTNSATLAHVFPEEASVTQGIPPPEHSLRPGFKESCRFSSMTQMELEEEAEKIIQRKRCFAVLDHIWRTFEDPESSRFAYWFACAMPMFVLATVGVTLVQTIDTPPLCGVPAAAIETAIDVIFLLEVAARYIACPNRSNFFLNWYNLIDVVAVAPLAIRASIGFVIPSPQVETIPQGILLCAVPTIRILKTLRRFEQFHLLLQAFTLAAEALPVLMFMLFVMTLVFAVLIYLVEPRENIWSLSHAIWFTIVTMTTVGYGDVIPESITGSVITGVLVVITLLYMAVPLGIIGNAFTQTWLDRDRILLTQRTRDRLRQWGFSAQDIPILFASGNDDEGRAGDVGGVLNIDDFRALMQKMQLGFNDERIYQLFKSFDSNHSGHIDDREFVRNLFPNDYHTIYEATEHEALR